MLTAVDPQPAELVLTVDTTMVVVGCSVCSVRPESQDTYADWNR